VTGTSPAAVYIPGPPPTCHVLVGLVNSIAQSPRPTAHVFG
jgi:hypothetical protein